MTKKQLIKKLDTIYAGIEGLEDTDLTNLVRINRNNYENLGEIIQELEDEDVENSSGDEESR